MSAQREIITGNESCYTCDCGFREYMSTNCNCEICKEYLADGKHLTHCPKCGAEFEVIDH